MSIVNFYYTMAQIYEVCKKGFLIFIVTIHDTNYLWCRQRTYVAKDTLYLIR